jgi:hypothetical protein
MSDEWLECFQAMPLLRNARGVSEAVAVKLLIEACAERLVRVRQRACWEEKDFGVAIPAFVWRDAHFADGVLFEAGTDMYTHPSVEGGYGHGVNGIIEFNAEDLHYWLSAAPSTEEAPSAKKRSRPQRERAKAVIDTLWPDGVPPQNELRNASLLKRVNNHLKKIGSPESISDDTILRAAGRKR